MYTIIMIGVGIIATGVTLSSEWVSKYESDPNFKLIKE